MIIVKATNGHKIRYRGKIFIEFHENMLSIQGHYKSGPEEMLVEATYFDLFFNNEIESIEGEDENGR